MVQPDGETADEIKPYMSENPWLNIPLNCNGIY